MNEFAELAKKLLAEQLDIDPQEIRLENTFDELNADSIDIVEMVMALEDVYNVEFPEDKLEDYSTLGALLQALYDYLQQVKND